MTPLSREITDALPRLRRYGRAVTGDRRTGDRYIHVALEILSEEPWRIWSRHGVKFHLYKLFNDVLSVLEAGPSHDVDREDPYHRLRLGVLGLPLLNRKLLLLVMLEQFPVARAAEMLELSEREAKIHLTDARAQLRHLTATLHNTDSHRTSYKQAA
jgi:DNA-directed RNA polymerase specialized sigma24 family protein